MTHLICLARLMGTPRRTCALTQVRVEERVEQKNRGGPGGIIPPGRRRLSLLRFIGLRFLVCALPLLLCIPSASAYPVYDADNRSIARLEPYQATELPAGARLPLERVDLRLTGNRNLDLPPPDQELGKMITATLGKNSASFAFAVLDFSDPERPRYAEHRGDEVSTAGSVGKLLVGLALFQALADAWPDDIQARERVLCETMVTADEVILSDSHDVPLVGADGKLAFRPLRQGDAANLWTWLDWMLSSSSNSAASMVLKQAMLLQRFGREYPVSRGKAEAAFGESEAKRQAWLKATLIEPVARNGLNSAQLQQGKFFTRSGKQLAPGFSSRVTVRELCRFMLRMEQGRLVDEFSSRELKRLLYLTEGRIRYAASPALYNAALYFKSGSLYSCTDEPGFDCGQYRGNKVNLLASVAVVESPAKDPKTFYIAAVVSNILRRNSADLHKELATDIHRTIMRKAGQDPVKAGLP
ncbi:serine hydrolase [Desulfocurvibacter africanus]|uniref:serine hydrolase n=1 Tax=Desulfocurvibacter africanus TaxID=873 RepID=UPI0004806FB2|nr:serine hydrolase [Desulfocurvibacter africanus]